jgi:sorbitol-specific phosphotransferase system component IIC
MIENDYIKNELNKLSTNEIKHFINLFNKVNKLQLDFNGNILDLIIHQIKRFNELDNIITNNKNIKIIFAGDKNKFYDYRGMTNS